MRKGKNEWIEMLILLCNPRMRKGQEELNEWDENIYLDEGWHSSK
jgi:hypothetical protein